MSAARLTRVSISALRRAAQLEREAHVGGDRHVRIERVVLEHHGDVALFRRHVVDDAVADADLAAGDVLQPRDHAQQGGLAAAGGADQHDELAVVDGHVTPWMTAVAPKALRTSRIATEAIHSSPPARREILYCGYLGPKRATNSASRAARNNGSVPRVKSKP